MKRILYSVCIGSLALALTAGAQQYNDRKPDRAKTHRTSNVRAAKPANTGAMKGAHRNISTAQNRQRSYTAPRGASNAAITQNARTHPNRDQNLARNQEFRARNNATVKAARPASATPATVRNRNVAINRTRNIKGARNTDELRARNNAAVTRTSGARPASATPATARERNIAVNGTRNVEVNRARNFNRTQNFAYYRGGNVRINNDFRSAAFRGQRYAVFRDYHRQWHDRSWWRSHYNRIVFVNGGWYYWNAGYWFPAWGYDPYVSYTYDGPVYAYNGLTPDRVIVDVQEQLQRDGYYDGPMDGILGPMTREAIAAFQADNGLSVTSVIDEPTLATLGIS